MDVRIGQAFNEIWTFYKTHYVIQDDPSEWDSLIDSAKVIDEKYKDIPIVQEFLILTIKDIERRN